MTPERINNITPIVLQAYIEYKRVILENNPTATLPIFSELPQKNQNAWFNAVDRVLELTYCDINRLLTKTLVE